MNRWKRSRIIVSRTSSRSSTHMHRVQAGGDSGKLVSRSTLGEQDDPSFIYNPLIVTHRSPLTSLSLSSCSQFLFPGPVAGKQGLFPLSSSKSARFHLLQLGQHDPCRRRAAAASRCCSANSGIPCLLCLANVEGSFVFEGSVRMCVPSLTVQPNPRPTDAFCFYVSPPEALSKENGV